MGNQRAKVTDWKSFPMLMVRRICIPLVVFAVGGLSCIQIAQSQESETETAEQKRERITAERFLMLLERRPRLGTALDKVYGYYVGRGSLAEFVQKIEAEAANPPNGNKYMVLGMIQMQRGQDASAVQAFAKAEELLPKEPLASYYLGKSLVLLGEVDKAASAMQRAISKKPARADSLHIFKDLGRIFQRTGQNEQALSVWEQLESLFPGDAGVQEQVAAVLAEEGAEQAALERYQRLAKTTKDRFRKVEMSIRAAQLKAKLGSTEEALEDFEKQLAVVNPESWLYRDIRRRIEEVFWASSDFDGLVEYYTNWTEEHPDDVDAMMRTAHVLSLQKRTPEALTWFRKAIERAPTNVEARQSLVESLASDGKYGDAATEMKALVEVEPDNPDFIVRWGELVYSDDERSKTARQQEVAEIWERMLVSRGDDPVTVSRVADLLRGAELTEKAISNYRQAISLAESEPQYREYLGEYLHQLQRKEEALQVWEELASGNRKTRDNIVRLSEVLSTFGYADKARERMAEACEMKPTFGHRARYAELLRENKEYDAALAQLDLAEPLADDRELRELLITERIKNFQASGTLKKKIEDLESAVTADSQQDAAAWRLLALLREADRAFQPACDAILKATQIAPEDVQIWETAAALYERTGQFGDAIKAYRKLSTLERRFLSNYLTQIASLEVRIGNIEEGLKAGEDLLASAPGNSDHYRFYANLCMQVGKVDQGLEVLRRNVRNNPNDSDALNHLASNLANEFKTDEAVELYWRSFDQARTVEDKTPIIESLAELYLRTNRFDMLLDRLEIISREENKPRDGILWISSAHQAAGDLGTARELLEQLVRSESRDTRLLEQLVDLSKAEYDYETAAEYQKRLVSIAPTPQGEYLLATFLMELGELDQAEGLWQKLTTRRGRGSTDLLTSVNSLISKEQFETAKKLVDRALQKDPDDWELLTPAMILSVRMEDMEQAKAYSDRALAMSIPVSTPTAKVQQRIKSLASQRNNNYPPGYQPFSNLGDPSTKLNVMQQIKSSLQPASGMYGGFGYSNRGYEPNCFGNVQTVAEGIQLLAIGEDEARKKFVTNAVEQALASNDADQLWRAVAYEIWEDPQALYQSNAANEDERVTECLEKLVELKAPAAAQMLFNREYNLRNQERSNGDAKGLSEEKLARMKNLMELTQQVQGARSMPSMYQFWLIDELKLAGQDDEANKLRDELLEEAKEPFELIQAASMSLRSLQRGTVNGDVAKDSVEQALPLFEKAINMTDSKTQNAAYVTQSMAGMVPYFAEYGDIDDAIRITEAVIRLQARLTAEMRPSQRSKAPTNPRMYYTIRLNNSNQRKQVSFPPPSGYFDAPVITTLNALVEVAKTKKQTDAVEKAVSDWAQEETDDPFLKFARLMAKSSVQYWMGQSAASAKTLDLANDLALGTQFVSLMSARMQYDSGDIRGALRTLESLQPSNQRMLVDRELSILELTVNLGDLERAKKSAQKLFALRLQSDTEFKLADLMYQLGMREMGDRMMGRIRRRAGGKQDTLVQLMQRYSTAGQMESAVEIARQIIRRTKPSPSSNYRTSENVQHQQALQILVRGKAIQPMIERYEKLVEKSPKSLKFVNQLAAMYEAAGKRKQAQELRMRSAESGAKDPRSLMQAAQQLAASGADDKAIDMFLEALKKSPDLLENEYYTLRDVFRRKNAFSKLVDLIESEGMSKFGRSNYRLGELASELVRAKEVDAAKKLQKLVLKGGDNYTITYLLEQLPSSKELYDDKELAELVADTITGSKVNRTNINFVRSRSSSGVGTGMANYLVRYIVPHEDIKAKVEEQLLSNIEADESDIFSCTVLCLMYAEDEAYDKVEELAESLYEELEEGETPNFMKGEARWAIASQMVSKEKAPELCVKILGCGKEFDPGLYQEKDYLYGPPALYMTALENSGDKELARKVMISALDKIEVDESQNQYNPGYGEYQYINAMDQLARKLLRSDCPAEAYIAYQKAYGDPEMLARSGRWSSSMATRGPSLMKSIKSKMTSKVVVGLITRAASDSEEGTQEFLTTASQTGKSMADARIEIPLEQFIDSVEDDGGLEAAMKAWSAETELGPAKGLGPIATRLIVAKAIEDKQLAAETSDLLSNWLEEHPAAFEFGGEEPGIALNKEQKAVLEGDLMLVVIARNLPREESTSELNVALIERAITAANLLEKNDLAFGLKCELASQLAARDKEKARGMFMEALDLLLPAESKSN